MCASHSFAFLDFYLTHSVIIIPSETHYGAMFSVFLVLFCLRVFFIRGLTLLRGSYGTRLVDQVLLSLVAVFPVNTYETLFAWALSFGFHEVRIQTCKKQNCEDMF